MSSPTDAPSSEVEVLIAELRQGARNKATGEGFQNAFELYREWQAAEALTALLAALEPFARIAKCFDDHDPDEVVLWSWQGGNADNAYYGIAIGDLRRARAVLQHKEPQ